MFRYTRFEKARIVGARALQIAMGAPVLIDVPEGITPLDAAMLEFEKGVVPITVIRPS
ncbi:DNA-directed RNA polymerase subunit K [Thermococcus sp.]